MVKAGECYFDTILKSYIVVEDIDEESESVYVSIYKQDGRKINFEYLCDERGYIIFALSYINSLVNSKAIVLADKDSLDSLLRVLI